MSCNHKCMRKALVFCTNLADQGWPAVGYCHRSDQNDAGCATRGGSWDNLFTYLYVLLTPRKFLLWQPACMFVQHSLDTTILPQVDTSPLFA